MIETLLYRLNTGRCLPPNCVAKTGQDNVSTRYRHFSTKGLLIIILLAILSPNNLLAFTAKSNPAKFANRYSGPPSSNANLANLTISQGTLSPAFANGTTSYTASVANNITTVTVTPTVADSTASVTVNGLAATSGTASGSIALNVGSNSIIVQVTAQDGVTTSADTIAVTRPPSSNASLANLTSSQGALSPAFASGTTGYTASVANNVTAVTITPSLADSTATIMVNGLPVASATSSIPIGLNVGPNTITIQVTAQDGVTLNTYSIIITRPPSSNASLAALTLSQGTLSPAFATSITNYTANVGNSITSLSVIATTADPAATITVNGQPVASGTASGAINLNVGQNIIIAQVTAQDGVTNISDTIIVTRPASSNANLAGLTLSQGTLSPAFAANTLNYTAIVGNNVTFTTITPLAADATATITVNGQAVASGTASAPISLNVGQNTVIIKVTAQDGLTVEGDTLIITRAASSNASLNAITLNQGALSPAFNSDSTNYTASVMIAKKEHTVYTMGDSITGRGEYQPPLDSLLNDIFTMVNLGIAGDHTTDMVNRFPLVVNAVPDYVIVLGGINDVLDADAGGAKAIENNLQSMYTKAHNAGIKVIALTITPSKGFKTWTSYTQAVQDSVNAWIPTAKNTDYVINTFSALVDPANTDQLLPAYDSGDHLHPNQAGENAIASAIHNGAVFTPNPLVDQNNTANSTMTITPVTGDPTATVTVNGMAVTSGSPSAAIPLSLGPNNIVTTVTAQDGTVKTYSLNVTGAPSNNAKLAYLGLSIGGLTLNPIFATGLTNYTTWVDHDTTSVEVRPTTMDANAAVTVNGAATTSGNYSAAIPLAVGPNTLTTTTTAQDGLTKNTYTVILTRLPVNLSNITLSTGSVSPAFFSTTTSYTASVANTVTSIAVTPTAADGVTTITVNGTAVKSGIASSAIPLAVGANTITVTVTGSDGATTYTITETRLPSSNAYLEQMKPSSGPISPTFSSATTNYTSSVANTTTSITITPNTADPTATVTVNGTAVALGVASGAIPLVVGPNTITTIVTAGDGVTQKTYTLVATRLPSSNANLELMKPSTGTISPAFSSATTAYTSSVASTVSSITITPNTAQPNATVTVNGMATALGVASAPVALAFGANTVTTTVTAQDGVTAKSYTLTVTRAPASSDATLSSLTISNGTLSPAFAAGTYSYTDGVGYGLKTMTVTPTANAANATVTVNGTTVTSGTPSGYLSLSVGNNTVSVVVTAQDGVTTKTYTLVINEARSGNNNLSGLAIGNSTLSPVFATGTTSYSASVPNSVSAITLTATLSDPTAVMTVNSAALTSGSGSNPIPLTVGVNTINVVVTAQNQTIKTYTITVTRPPSSNANLTSLALSQGTLSPAFSGNIFSYNAGTVPNRVTSATITPVLADLTATVIVNGSPAISGSTFGAINLNVGQNTIVTTVTAQDGITIDTYTTTITRAPSSNAILAGLSLSQGTIAPAFAAGTTRYTDSVINSVATIAVTPVTADPTAVVTINGIPVASGTTSGAISLSIGPNIIITQVTAQDGVTTTGDTITVTRPPSSNASLASIALSQGTLSPAFANGTTSYTASVPYSATTITVTPTPADFTAAITVNGQAVTTGTSSAPIGLNLGPNLIAIQVTAQDGVTTSSDTIIVTRQLSTNASLANLVVSQGTISPAFAASTTGYTAGVANNITSITVTPTVADPTATITVNGTLIMSGTASAPVSLNLGPNTILVQVTAQDGVTTSADTLTITRQFSANASLANLTISQGMMTPAFTSAVSNYAATVSNNITSVTVTPTLADSTATVTVNGLPVASGAASGSIVLNVGMNLVIIQAIAQDEVTTSSDTITVTRPPSSNSALNNLTLSQGALTPAFSNGISSYTATEPNNVASVTITPVVADSTATLTVNGTPVITGNASGVITLNVGQNTITTQVTAQDGVTTSIFTVVVTRLPSSNASLNNLTLSQGTLSPLFANSTNTYTANVGSGVTSLTVTPVQADPTAMVTVNGMTVVPGTASAPVPLTIGQTTITTQIIAQDGVTTNTFVITVTRPPSSNANLANLTVSQAVISPGFSAGTTTYTASVSNTIASVTIAPFAADPTATIMVNGTVVTSGQNSASIPLNIGANTITTQVTAQDGLTTSTYTLTITRFPVDLKNLLTSSGILNPAFSNTVTSYTSSIINTVSSITVTPYLAETNNTITVNGTAVKSGIASQQIPLAIGPNIITVIASGSNGKTTYTLTATRLPSSNANLELMQPSAGIVSPAFSSGVSAYTSNVASNISSITITPNTAQANATVTVNGAPVALNTASAPIQLVAGPNAITTVVTAQDGVTQKAYTLTVNRASALTDATLSNFQLSNGTLSPAFASGTYNYTTGVGNGLTTMTVTPTTTASGATITVNGLAVNSGTPSQYLPLLVGADTINTVVTAPDGVTTQTYRLIISEARSPNNILAGLTSSAGAISPVFSGGVITYNQSVANSVTAITVTPATVDPTATMTVNGVVVISGSASQSLPLVVGTNAIVVVVTAQNQTQKTYTLTVTRAASANNLLNNLMISQGTLAPSFVSGTTSYSAGVTIVNKQHTIYTTGDSITSNGEYQISLSTLLNNLFYIVDVAISGSETPDMVKRFGLITNAAPDYTIILGGSDDITHIAGCTATSIENNLQAMYTAAHNAGSKVIALKLTPFKGNVNWNLSTEAVLDSVNRWLPTAINVDNVVDTYSAIVDPANPYQMLPAYDSGDHFHPSKAGQDAMAAAIYAAVTFVPKASIDQGNLANAAITITPVTADPTATVSVNNVAVASGSASPPIILSKGINPITTNVTAQNGTVKTYTLNMNGGGSNNANLADMSASTNGNSLTPYFDPAITSYTATVNHDSTMVRVKLFAADPNATMTLNGLAVLNTKAPLLSLNVGPNIMNIVVTAADGVTQKTYTLNEMRLYSTNANLELMKPSVGTLSPVFSSQVTSYTSSVTSATSSITITPNVADPTATITVNGIATALGTPSAPIALSAGQNIITTVVTAQDGITTKTYTLVVTKPSATSDASLSNIQVSNGTLSPAFVATGYNYSTVVGYGLKTMTVTPSTGIAGNTITVNGQAVTSGTPSSYLPLVVGANTINILVTGADGVTTQNYSLVITESRSTISTLAALTISNGTLSPAFTTVTTNYTASVAYPISSVTLKPLVTDPNATVAINGTAVVSGNSSAPISLVPGANTIVTVVTAQSGATTTYNTVITRVLPSTNALLAGLIVSKGALSPVFAAGTNSYTNMVTNATTSLTVTPTTADPTATVTVNGIALASGKVSGAIALAIGYNTITVNVTAQNGVTTDTYTITVLRPSTNAKLSALTLSSGTLTPGFNGSAFSYAVSLPFTSATIVLTPTPAVTGSTVTINGKPTTPGAASAAIPLAYGTNTIVIVVTAQDGVTTSTYTLTITRATPSSNANLASLVTSKGSFAPGPGGVPNSITQIVTNSTASVTVTPTTADPTATLTVNGNAVISGNPSAPIMLAVGSNVITIVVTAQDGITVQTYTLNIIRPSTNAKLSALTLSSGSLTPVFNTNTTSYSVSVPYLTTTITLTPTAAATGANITLNGAAMASGTASGPIALNIGANTITVFVTAQDGVTTDTYTVTVTRAAPSANANLTAITLNKGSLAPAFAATTTNYTDMVTNGTASVTLTPVTADPTATVTVNGAAVVSGAASGAIALAVGSNAVTVAVTAQNGTVQTYTVNVIRPSTNAKLSLLAISSGTLSPVFNTNTTSYTASVTNATASITVTPTVAVTGATVTVNGNAVASGSASGAIALNVGSNTITTIVTAQDGVTTDTYTATITRAPGSNDEVYQPVSVGVQNPEPLLADDGINVHQGVSPNGDGINDYLQIDNITNYPDNNLKIMNRNGLLIYETKGYDNSTRVFDGHSNKTGQMQLPGTYFYELDYTVGGVIKHKTGYLVLKY